HTEPTSGGEAAAPPRSRRYVDIDFVNEHRIRSSHDRLIRPFLQMERLDRDDQLSRSESGRLDGKNADDASARAVIFETDAARDLCEDSVIFSAPGVEPGEEAAPTL